MKFSSPFNVLLLGSGGREHAFAWKIAQSKHLAKLYIAPGNAGTAQCGTNVEIKPTNFAGIKQFVLKNHVNIVVVGPEEPLVKGLYDYFKEDSQIQNIPVIGPSKMGAKLEGSKDFAKAFMVRNAIPTAAYRSFTTATVREGEAFLEELKAPYVLKADGLAAGKGVLIIESLEEAKKEFRQMLSGKFGAAGSTVVIEEYLSGVECSFFVATDGKSFTLFPEAKDYKRIGEGDTGPNTGGMGAISPVPFADEAFVKQVVETIVQPTIHGLRTEKIDYKGFIFIGLMVVNGKPYVIEYNVRMGDPETESVLARVESDILELFKAMALGVLERYTLKISPHTAATVVCVSQGYPAEYEQGMEIKGLGGVTALESIDPSAQGQSILFHAGTSSKAAKVFTAGGRVVAVTALAPSIPQAVESAMQRIEQIDYKGKYYRSDIGQDLIEMQNPSKANKK